MGSFFLISSTYSINPVRTRKLETNFQHFPLIIRAKKSSNYQDFQEYARPSRLLPAKVSTSVENEFVSSGRFESLYNVKLQTSKIYGSGLSDVNSGILLCLIDENESSILQRLSSATSVGIDSCSEDDTLHFQRGSIDEFAFEGPNLGRISAVWISLESGQWRIGGITLRVICPSQRSSGENNQQQLTGLQYNFELEDILLGENGEASMMEFRPNSVSAVSEVEPTLFYEKSLNTSTPSGSYLASNEESMKEYTYLKLSLLFYDVALILVGSSVLSVSTGESAAYVFLTGGLCGFFYLLLLQRSVDALPAPELIRKENKGSFSQIFGRLKGPSSSLVVLAFAFAFAFAVKYISLEDALKLTPKDLIFGLMGFLTCKVSVVLAALKPISFSSRDNKQGL